MEIEAYAVRQCNNNQTAASYHRCWAKSLPPEKYHQSLSIIQSNHRRQHNPLPVVRSKAINKILPSLPVPGTDNFAPIFNQAQTNSTASKLFEISLTLRHDIRNNTIPLSFPLSSLSLLFFRPSNPGLRVWKFNPHRIKSCGIFEPTFSAKPNRAEIKNKKQNDSPQVPNRISAVFLQLT